MVKHVQVGQSVKCASWFKGFIVMLVTYASFVIEKTALKCKSEWKLAMCLRVFETIPTSLKIRCLAV